MKPLVIRALNFALVLAAFALAAVFYPRLPAVIPIHWDASGTANGFAPKLWGAFLMPLTMLGTYLLFLVLPAISPQGYRMQRFGRTYEVTGSTGASKASVQAARLAFERGPEPCALHCRVLA